MNRAVTQMGSLREFKKGYVEIYKGNSRRFVFSNIFDVANCSAAYDRTAVACNGPYTLETLKAEGTSEWFGSSHDEFLLVMDGTITVTISTKSDSVELSENGAVIINEQLVCKNMGVIIAEKGHMVLLPADCAYQFHTPGLGVLIIQTMAGPLTRYRWSEICQN